MATIEVEVEINASVDKVWDVVSDIDNEPKFWKGTKEVHNISKEGNKVNREIIIAFRDQKCLQEVTITPKEKIEARFTKGIIDGEKIVSLIPNNETTVLKHILGYQDDRNDGNVYWHGKKTYQKWYRASNAKYQKI